MNIDQLKYELDLLNVNPYHYSLNGELKPDCIILIDYYGKWEVYYLDERGGRHNCVYFQSEYEACLHIHNLFVEAKKISNKFGLKNS